MPSHLRGRAVASLRHGSIFPVMGSAASLDRVPSDLLDEVHRRHAEPQRAYHDWSHIEALLRLFEELESSLRQREAVFHAILFHDAIYDPKARDNEERSAELLAIRCGGMLAPDVLAAAVWMVEATKRHMLSDGIPADEAADTAHFLDMDLSILGADPAAFDRYERQIRQEYAHVSDADFREGRARVLRSFGDRERLFLSESGRRRFEGAARSNLARSLSRLAEPVPRKNF